MGVQMHHDSLLAPAAALAELARIDLAKHDLEGVLTRVSYLAKRTIPGAADVSVTLLDGGRAYSGAASGPIAFQLDATQYAAGHGPCLDAAADVSVVHLRNVRNEERWPQYVMRAVEGGVLSSLSLGLPMQRQVTGSLNIYGTTPNAFDNAAVNIAQTFVAYAGVAVGNAEAYARTVALITAMHRAEPSLAVIEQAKGIVMMQSGCTGQEALDVLERESRVAKRELPDVAQGFVDSVLRR